MNIATDNKSYGVIYKTTNLLNGKLYIGQTVYIQNVINGKYKGSGTILWNAINKHGIENFKTEIISYANNKEDLDKLEKEFINRYNTIRPFGYNLREGGSNGKMHDETKEKIRKSRDGMILSKEHKENLSKSLTGRKLSKSHKENIGKYISENRVGENNPMFGKSLSDNHKNILSSSFKEKGNPFYGKVHTEESKEKMKKSWECRSLKTSPNKGKKMSQEQKDKISKTLKEKKKENLILLYRNY